MLNKLIILAALGLPCAAQQCQVIVNGTVTLKSNGKVVTLCGASTSNVLTAIKVAPVASSVLQGTPVSYTATGTFADGSTGDVTLLSTWASTNSAVASVGATANPQPVACGASANATVTVSATIGGIIGSGTLTCNPPPHISPTSLPNGTQSVAYSALLTATGGVAPYVWTQPSGTLPTGVTLATGSPTATLSGTASAAGNFSFVIQVCDSQSHCVTQNYTVTIAAANSRTPQLPQAWVNEQEGIQSYTHTITVPISSGTMGALGTFTCSNSTVYGPFAGGLASFQSFMASVEACRANAGDSFSIKFAPGSVFTITNSSDTTAGAHGFYLPQSTSPLDTSSSPIVFDSTTPIPLGTNLDPNGVTTQARVGTYAISQTSGIVCTSGICTATTAVPMAATPAVGDLATIWQPDNRAYAGQFAICGSPCSSPTTTTFQYRQPEDLVLWMSSSAANRIANHMTGSGNPHYSWMDADGEKFWLIKGISGHPWDINTFDSLNIYHSITEDGDSASQAACIAAGFSSCFVDQFAYKRHINPVPIMPRYLAQDQTVSLDTPSAGTTVIRTTNCETAGTTDTVTLGPVHAVTFFTTGDGTNGGASWGGGIGAATTLENDFFYGLSGGVYQDKEVFQYVKGLGLIQWTFYTWNGSAYVQSQVTTDVTTTSGGSPTPVFPCSTNLTTNGTWIGGAPGSGGNSSSPTAVGNGTTQNGTLFSLQKQNTITSMTSAGCSAALAQCTVTVNFASSPGLSVGDRFEITGASPSWFNGTWYVATTGTNTITFPTYTEYIGNLTATSPGVLLHKNHILADQHDCCMYTLELQGGSGPLIMADPQAHNYAFYNGEARVQPTTNGETFILVTFGNYLTYSSPQTPQQLNFSGCNGLIAQSGCDEAVHVGLDRMYIHGASFPTVTNTQAQIRKAVLLECGYCYLTNSYAEDINDTNSDNNIVATTYGTGPIKVVNNYLEGATEAIMSGYYAACQKVQSPFQQVADVEIRRNWITGNPFQTMNAAVLIPGLSTKYLNYILKNKVEIKAGKRVLYDGNVLQYSAGAAGQQNGTVFSVNDQSAASCSAGSVGNQGSIVSDVTYTNNILRHALAGGYQTSSTSPSTSPSIMEKTGALMYVNNLGYDLGDPTRFGRPGWGGTSWSGFGFSQVFQFGTRGWSFPPFTQLSVTSVAAASGGSTVYTGNITNGASNTYAGQPVIISGFVNSANNGTFTASASTATTLTLANASGVAETKAATALMQGCTGSTAVVGGVKIATLTCPNYSQGVPNAIQPGMGMHAGDWIEVVNCVDSNYNVSAPQEVPITSESFFNFTVSYPVPSAAGASPGGGCKVNNQYGYARFLTYSHNTMLYDGSITNSFYNNVQMGGGEEFLWTAQSGSFQLKRDTWIQNNLVSYKQTTFASGPQLMHCAGTSSSNSKGETFCYDTNTFVWTNNVMSGGGTASKYTEWNAPNGVAGTNNAATPPVTDIFLANGTPGDSCTNPLVPASSCFGFAGNAANLNPPDFGTSSQDYHLFALRSNSNWAAAQLGQASDATDTGVNMLNIDTALTLGQYVCPTTCGTGPFP